MKKKWKVFSLVVAVAAFSTLSLTASYASDYQPVSTEVAANSVKPNDIIIGDKVSLVSASGFRLVMPSQSQLDGKYPLGIDGLGSHSEVIFDK